MFDALKIMCYEVPEQIFTTVQETTSCDMVAIKL